VEFTWDERKNRVNQQKHGVSFETAILVFDDPYHLTRQDREVEASPAGRRLEWGRAFTCCSSLTP